MRTQSGSGGFTLIELLVVVALVAILQSLATPALSAIVNSIQLTTVVNSLLSSLHLARSEAAKHNTRAVVCKSASGDACTTAGGWDQGWIVFHDSNNNAALDEDETVLLRQQALPPDVLLKGNMPVAHYVSFTPVGTTRYVSGAFQAGTLTVCQRSASRTDARQIVISSSGRPRTVRTTVDSCPQN